jgi:poly-gamma-glutamate capsule biosynthesis protein CapA/YwtB (metallophosphatase superfamily)
LTSDAEIPARVVVSALGDCTLGGDQKEPVPVTPFDAEATRNASDATWPFSGVVEVLSRDDVTIANLEGALTMRTEPAPGGAFRFRAKPRYADRLRAGRIEIVGSTNNHVRDFGDEGVLDTLWALN